jgi:hypothetical protein
MKEWGVDGHLESLAYGVAKGNQTLVYSVKAKRKKKGQPWTGSSVVRVERRLRNPKPHKLAELPKLTNPFAGLVLTTIMPGPPPGEKPWQWSMFEDTVNVRGLANALALLPEERRTKYRKHLKEHQHAWWDPSAIWGNWPETLNELQIGSLAAWW